MKSLILRRLASCLTSFITGSAPVPVPMMSRRHLQGISSSMESGVWPKASRNFLTPAVCVPPGARLLLRDIPKDLQCQFDVQATEEVTFVQLSAEAYQYRDAVRFRNGREVLLQRLKWGQRVEILSLCSHDSREEKHQQREEEYRQVFVG